MKSNYDACTDEQLIDLIRAGDRVAEELLYTKYKQVVRSCARTYFLVGADREDILQEGMIGLYKAVCDYDSTKQTSFRSFAELCITRQIISAIKSATRKKHIPLNTYISFNRTIYDGDSERTLVDVLAGAKVSDPAELVIGQESYDDISQRIQKELSHLERTVLQLYLSGYSYQQIADALQRSPKAVDNAIQRVKKKFEALL